MGLITINEYENIKINTRKEADIMVSKENEYCDLLLAIKQGERDV